MMFLAETAQACPNGMSWPEALVAIAGLAAAAFLMRNML